MFWLGLVLPLAYIPSVTGSIIPSGWVFLSAVLPFLLWSRTEITAGHWIGAAFLVIGFASISWSTQPQSGIETMWHWSVLGMAFCVGARQESVEPFFRGLGIGMLINALIAVLGLLRVVYIPSVAVYPSQAALFFNPNMLGETAAIILIGLLWQRQWLLACGPAICLALSQSRLGLVAFFVVAVALIVPSRLRGLVGACGLALVVLLFLFKDGLTAVTVRTDIWSAAFPYLRVIGNGAGSLLMETKYGMVEHLHNDLLELVFEFGIFAVVPLALIAWAFIRAPEHRPVIATFSVIALASFPSFLPVSGAVVAFVAGNAYRARHMVRADSVLRRLAIQPRMATQ